MVVAAASPQARAPQQRALIPFRKGTRQHFDKAGEITYTSNRTGTPLRLPQFGFLGGLLLRVTGTMNLGVAPALTADGPWALVNRIRVALNTGIEIVSLTGFGAFLLNFLIKEEFAANTSAQAQVFAAPVVASANNTWAFMLWFPIAANDGQNFEVGLINLQTEELVAVVEVDWAAETAAVAPIGTGFTGRMDVFMLWYEVPDPRRVQFPPLNIVHRVVEDRTPITGTGDARYILLRQGTIQQLIQTVRLNGARNTVDVTALRLELNRADRVYRYELAPQLWHQAMRYGQDLPAGVFVWDFWHSQMDVSQGDGRDFVDTEAVAQIDAVIEIASGAVLGANNNFQDNIRRHTLVLRP